MSLLGPLGFVSPWLLAAGLALPVVWLILRAAPPLPRRIRFPGVALLAGLVDPAPRAARTPWWLLLLRCAALAALIIGMAGPVWRPDPAGDLVASDADAVLVVLDAGWAAAPDWPARQARAIEAVEAAGSRPVAVLIGDGMTPGPLVFGTASEAAAAIRAAAPGAWPSAWGGDGAEADAAARTITGPQAALALAPEVGLATFWLSDGLAHPGRAAWVDALAGRGEVRVQTPAAPVQMLGLSDDPVPVLLLTRLEAGAPDTAEAPALVPPILAIGPDPQGAERVLARLVPPPASDGEDPASLHRVPIDLPSEMRNRVTRFALEGVESAGAVVLADARTRRPKLALTGTEAGSEGLRLLDPGHYLRRAVIPFADLVEGAPAEVLQSAPDVVVLIDSVLPPDEATLGRWVAAGGTLIRFAGPRMAASEALALDPLLPVRLRPGGRETGGALSWGEARGLAPWPADGPLGGLEQAPLAVRAQLVAEPGPELEPRILARLQDATPLITRAPFGEGQVILFHVAADPSWSDLPLSGLFPRLLERLAETARQPGGDDTGDATPAAHWRPLSVLDGWGRMTPAPDGAEPVASARLDGGPVPGLPAGLYQAEGRLRALNAGQGTLAPAEWGAGVRILGAATGAALRLGGWFLLAAGLLFALDVLASARLSGSVGRMGRGRGAATWRGA